MSWGFFDQERATSPVGCVVQHVYTGACLKSVRIVCSLVWLVISPTGSHEEKLGGSCCSLAFLWGQWAVCYKVDVTSSEDSSESQEGSGEEFLPGTEVSFSLEDEEDEEVEEVEGRRRRRERKKRRRKRQWRMTLLHGDPEMGNSCGLPHIKSLCRSFYLDPRADVLCTCQDQQPWDCIWPFLSLRTSCS